MSKTFSTDLSFARRLDRLDPLAWARGLFHVPRDRRGRPRAYLCGNSLGLAPKAAEGLVQEEFKAWKELAVHGHFKAKVPWFSYHEVFRKPLSMLVGAKPGEVVAMNSLSVNLQLMLVSFYQPTRKRFKILIEDQAFPSDRYAAGSHLRQRGLDPARSLRVVKPRPGETLLREEDIAELLEREGKSIALVLFGGVHYLTGQVLDMRWITAAARRQGAKVCWDLAHAVGNVPLKLHDWNVDCAVWCSYKYLNGGPGAIGGCFVHERHGRDTRLPRLSGWWGNQAKTRFQMPERFIPAPGADGWQVSNPPILAMTPLRASLDIFSKAGMKAITAKSKRMTEYMDFLLDPLAARGVQRLTPRDGRSRGSQVSLKVHGSARRRQAELEKQGIDCDLREPDILRAAPVPLYNTFEDIWRFAKALGS